MLATDYLVIGAGAASMAFIDTLITEQPNIHVTVVDKHSAPGGHWNDAYGYVHLHQPSLVYGVTSQQLEGSWMKLMLLQWTLPWSHRASKTELLDHYKSLMDKWVDQKRVSYYPNCVYDFDQTPGESCVHVFASTTDNKEQKTFQVQVKEKLVNGVSGECRVPSKNPPQFPVDEEQVTLMTPNQIYACKKEKTNLTSKKFVVLGCGKTAMDAVVFLQRNMGVSPDDITWVIPNDVWMLTRARGGPSAWPNALLRNDLDSQKAVLELESNGVIVRLDPNIMPTKFRFAVIGEDEIALMRKVKNIVRGQGRVTSLKVDNEHDDNVILEFQMGKPLHLNRENHIFVHCTSPGPFNGNKEMSLFPSDKEINLGLLYAPPVPISMSCLATLESRRKNGTLDVDFGRKLICARKEKNDSSSKEISENDVLNELIRGYNLGSDALLGDPKIQLGALVTMSTFFGLLDKDPAVAQAWMKSNRLSMLSIPGAKGRVYETASLMASKKDKLGFSKGEADMLTTLAGKLKTLEGK